MFKDKPEIPIVNKNDKIIGYKKRDKIEKNDIYRVAALWITNSKNQILLAKRHRTKIHHPNKWGPAVAGTVEKGETYKTNIIKETFEELGLQNISFTPGPKTETNNGYHHFTQWYFLTIDKKAKDFIIQADEVSRVKWFDIEELKNELKTHPENFLPNMKIYIKLFISL